MKLPKDLRPLTLAAKRSGWTFVQSRSGHLLWVSPTGVVLITAGTPSYMRGIRNHRAALRRAGLRV